MREQDKQKIISFIEQKEFDKANRMIKSCLSKDILSKPQIIETFFSFLHSYRQRQDILKYLDLNRVPPRPVDTSYDVGRRFFYALVIATQRGGHKVVGTYLNEIIVHRIMEYRFLGGIYFALLDFKSSYDCFNECVKRLKKEEYESVLHFNAISNVLFSAYYAGMMDEYFEAKNYIQHTYGNSFDVSIAVIDGMLAVENRDVKELSNIISNHKIPPLNRTLLESSLGYLNGNMDQFNKSLNEYMNIKLEAIKLGLQSPRRLFFSMLFFKNLIGCGEKELSDFFTFNNFSYPISDDRLGNMIMEPAHKFKELGDANAENYINLNTEEFRINGIVGMTLSTEVKAIAMIVRAGGFGISFEYLAGEIYEELGYSDLFHLRERVKQVIHRIKSKYNVKVKVQKFVAFIEGNDSKNFRIDLKPSLSLLSDVSVDLNSLCRAYGISESKARKYLKKYRSTS